MMYSYLLKNACDSREKNNLIFCLEVNCLKTELQISISDAYYCLFIHLLNYELDWNLRQR